MPDNLPIAGTVADFGSLAGSRKASPMALRPDLAIGLPFSVCLCPERGPGERALQRSFRSEPGVCQIGEAVCGRWYVVGGRWHVGKTHLLHATYDLPTLREPLRLSGNVDPHPLAPGGQEPFENRPRPAVADRPPVEPRHRQKAPRRAA